MAERESRTAGAQNAAETAQALLKDARTKASAEVSAGKDRVTGELASARRDVEATVAQLSAEIARRMLQTPPRPGSPMREAR